MGHVSEEGIEKKAGGGKKKGHRVTGIIVSVLGFLWLAKKAGWMPAESHMMPHHTVGSALWPLGLIAAGIVLIYFSGNSDKKHSQ